jgi:hypothetical protein
MEGAVPATPLPAEPGLLARWMTGANGAEVYDFYVDALPDAGFAVEQLAPGGAVAVIGFTTREGRLLNLALTAGSGGGTRVDLREPGPMPE